MGQAVLAAISAGGLPSDQEVRRLQALADQSRLVEVEELEPRIATLAAANGHA